MDIRHLRRELADWRVPARLALPLFVAPLVVTLGLALLRTVDRDRAFSLLNEDQAVEWATVAGFATAAAFGALGGLKLLRYAARAPAVAYLLFAAGCFLVAGEEISWGQRILDFGTPEHLTEINTQDQTNLHNIDPLEKPFKLAQLLIGLCGTVGVWAVRVVPWTARKLRLPQGKVDLFIPPLFLTSSFLVVAVVQLAIAAGADDPPHNQFYGELAEFTLSFGLAAFALLSWRRLRALVMPPAAQQPPPPLPLGGGT